MMRLTHFSAAFLLILVFALLPGFSGAATVFRPLKTRITVNSADRGEHTVYRDSAGGIYLKRETFRDIEVPLYFFKEKMIAYGNVKLSSLAPGLTFEFRENPPELAITVEKGLLTSKSIRVASKKIEPVRLDEKNTYFLNYNFDYFNNTENDNPVLYSPHEFVASNSAFTFQHRANAQLRDGEWDWSRQLTNVVKDDVAGMRRLVAGDFSITAGQLGGAAALGGLSYSTAYFTNPSFVTYSVPTVAGMMDQPGKIEIYANGTLVTSRSILPGSYEFVDLGPLMGATDLKVVKTYSDGTTEEEYFDAYVSRRLLKEGLSDFSYGFGWSRTDSTNFDFSYDKPRFVMRHNYGVDKKLTMGVFANVHPEGYTRGLFAQTLAGSSGDLVFQFGKSSYKTEEEWKDGWSAIASYLYSGGKRNFGIEFTRKSDDYTSGSAAPLEDGGYFRTRLNFSGKLGKQGYFTTRYEYANFKEREDERSLSYSLATQFFKKLSVALRGQYSWTEEELDTGLSFTLPFADRNSLSASSVFSSDGSSMQNVTLEKSASVEPGPYYSISALRRVPEPSEADEIYSSLVSAGYSFAHGDVSAKLNSNSRNSDSYRLGLKGSVGVAGGEPFMSRPIRDSVLLVLAGDLDGIPVGLSSRPQNYTEDGFCVLPSFAAYSTQTVTADLNGLPAEYKSDKNEIPVVIGFRKGGVVDLEIKKTTALQAIVNFEIDGRKTPAEFAEVEFSGGGAAPRSGFTALKGLLYFEDIPAGDWSLRITGERYECNAAVTVPKSDDILIDLGEINCVARERVTGLPPAQPPPGSDAPPAPAAPGKPPLK